MPTRILEHVNETPPQEIGDLTLEDMALSLAWWDSLDDDPAPREPFPAIPSHTGLWVEKVHPPVSNTEGRRQQPLLRMLLDDLQDTGNAALGRSELDVLHSAYELIRRSSAPRLFERISALLEPRIRILSARRSALPPAPALPVLRKRIRYLSAADLEQARPRSIRSFSGVDMPGRGPLHTVSGHVKVIDHVPEECMLVVERGSCTVGGYVLGKVAAKQSCEVRENIAGAVIVSEGQIRARKIINNAFVVSKLGAVRARSTENPTLVYAGTRIDIVEDAMMGQYASPAIAVGGEILGGDFGVSRSLTAHRFRQTGTRRLTLFLQRKVTCESYGEFIGTDASRILAKIAKLRRRRRNIRTMARIVGHECEHFASNAITFLFSGDKLGERVEDINAQQRRLGFLDRVIAGIDALSISAEEQLQLAQRVWDESAAASESAFQDLDHEITEIESESRMDADLSEERDELRELTRKMGVQGGTNTLATSVVFRLREKKVSWLLERDAIVKRIAAQERELKQILGHVEAIEKLDPDVSRTQSLQRILSAARRNALGNTVAQRANSRFIGMMLRSVETRTERLRNFAATLEELDNDIEAESRGLEKDYSVMAPTEPDADQDPPTVQGRFQAGITLCTEHYLLEETNLPPGSKVITQDSGSKETRYARHPDGIREESP